MCCCAGSLALANQLFEPGNYCTVSGSWFTLSVCFAGETSRMFGKVNKKKPSLACAFLFVQHAFRSVNKSAMFKLESLLEFISEGAVSLFHAIRFA